MSYCHPALPSSTNPFRALLFTLASAASLAASQNLCADNLPPKVAILQPTDGQTFVNLDQVQILAEVSDADGSVARVEVFTAAGCSGAISQDPAIATDLLHPFHSWTWSNPGAGKHTVSVYAQDNGGAWAFSAPVTITVTGETVPTAASLVIRKPVGGQIIGAPGLISIEVVAVDPAGDIRHVEFYANDQLIGRSDQWTKDAVFPGRPREHYLEWKASASGVYQLVAKALDSSGQPVESKPVSVTVALDMPVISITAPIPDAAEPTSDNWTRPAMFTLARSGDTANPLTVSLAYEGTATPGLDYVALPETVTFSAGADRVDLAVKPIADSLVEGMETIVASLVPPVSDAADYIIDPLHQKAKVGVLDAALGSSAILEITAPAEGDQFKPGEAILINATAVDPNGYIARVEFFDSFTAIGVSQLAFFRAPDPGTPIYHSFEWKEPPPGDHVLTARAIDALGQTVVSKPVLVRVSAEEPWPTVQIAALDSEATEFPPFVDAFDPARFVISRDGDLSKDMYVLFSLQGTAEPEKDYKRPERIARIPAGARDVTIEIVPLSDEVAEGMETVGLRLEDPRPVSSFPYPPYNIQTHAQQAAAVIYEGRPPENGGLDLAFPSNGETYVQTEPLLIIAGAFYPTADVSHVDFYAGDTQIGGSDAVLGKRCPDGGVPVDSDLRCVGGLIWHQFVWKGPLPGEQVITARAMLPDGKELISKPIQITIKAIVKPPAVTVVQPQNAAVFRPDESIDIKAAAQESAGTSRTLQILIDNQVAASGKDPELSFRASGLAPGPHVIEAATVDSTGAQARSMPVKILVLSPDGIGGGGSAPAAELKRIDRQLDGNVRLQLSGPANGACVLETSSDLVHWIQVGPVFLPDGHLAFEEDARHGPSQKFYRAKQQ